MANFRCFVVGRKWSRRNSRSLHERYLSRNVSGVRDFEFDCLEDVVLLSCLQGYVSFSLFLFAQGFSQEEAKKAVSGHPDAHPEAVKIVNETASTTASTDSTTNYAVIGGIVGALALGYWYFSGSSDSKKKDDKE